MSDLQDPKSGKFLPGNPGNGGKPGPGRPRQSDMERLRAAISDIVQDDETLACWVRSFQKKIKRGSLPASAFLWDHVLGKVAVRVDVGSDAALTIFMQEWAALVASELQPDTQAALPANDVAALPPGDPDDDQKP